MAKVHCVNGEQVHVTDRQAAIIQGVKREFKDSKDLEGVLQDFEPRTRGAHSLASVMKMVADLLHEDKTRQTGVSRALAA